MPTGHSSDVKLEIGHVLFMDIVGYSKLLIHEQSEQQQQLNQIVRGTEQFRAAKKSGKLMLRKRTWRAEHTFIVRFATTRGLSANWKQRVPIFRTILAFSN